MPIRWPLAYRFPYQCSKINEVNISRQAETRINKNTMSKKEGECSDGNANCGCPPSVRERSFVMSHVRSVRHLDGNAASLSSGRISLFAVMIRMCNDMKEKETNPSGT